MADNTGDFVDDPQLTGLVCPVTHQRLRAVCRKDAERLGGAALRARRSLVNARGRETPPLGVTDIVLLRDDLRAAYPIVDGIPVLLAPELLAFGDEPPGTNLTDPVFAEAYEEMEVYNEIATREAAAILRSEAFAIIEPILSHPPEARARFPAPRKVWIDAVYDAPAQWDAYAHVGPVGGRRVLQLGGKGIHAVKMLLAGAAQAWVVTPMLGEARCARALAAVAGVSHRLYCAVAVAEQLPFESASFDAIYSGGCLHHMSTSLALPEAARVLCDGGRFAAVDPWKAPLCSLGIRLFGKREKDVYCRPLDPQRLAPLGRAFREARVVHHGALTRYPMLALSKLGVPATVDIIWNLNRVDDAISSMIAPLRRAGSSIAVLGTK